MDMNSMFDDDYEADVPATTPVLTIEDLEATFAVDKRTHTSDPAGLGFPPSLPMELALRENTPKVICEAYGIDKAEFEHMLTNPIFLQAIQNCTDLLAKDGYSFKAKAGLQAEELLKRSWEMIHDNNVPPAVRADLIKATVKWSGFEPKTGEGVGQGSAFNIQINLA